MCGEDVGSVLGMRCENKKRDDEHRLPEAQISCSAILAESDSALNRQRGGACVKLKEAMAKMETDEVVINFYL